MSCTSKVLVAECVIASYLLQTELQKFGPCPFTFERACWMYCVRIIGVNSLFILKATFTPLWLWTVLHLEQLSHPGARGRFSSSCDQTEDNSYVSASLLGILTRNVQQRWPLVCFLSLDCNVTLMTLCARETHAVLLFTTFTEG